MTSEIEKNVKDALVYWGFLKDGPVNYGKATLGEISKLLDTLPSFSNEDKEEILKVVEEERGQSSDNKST